MNQYDKLKSTLLSHLGVSNLHELIGRTMQVSFRRDSIDQTFCFSITSALIDFTGIKFPPVKFTDELELNIVIFDDFFRIELEPLDKNIPLKQWKEKYRSYDGSILTGKKLRSDKLWQGSIKLLPKS